MPPSLMLDPSLFTSFRTIRIIEEAFRAGDLEDAVLPNSFVNALDRGEFGEEQLRFFGASQAEIHDLGNLRRVVPKIEGFTQAIPVADPLGELAVNTELLRILRNPQTFEIVREEWLFLNSQSWIASRTRRTFSSFIKAGAVAVETGKRVSDKVLARTLKMPTNDLPLALTGRKRLRAASKWIAVAGRSATSLVHLPIPGALTNAALGFFLLLDP